jgi:hypothetical protein
MAKVRAAATVGARLIYSIAARTPASARELGPGTGTRAPDRRADWGVARVRVGHVRGVDAGAGALCARAWGFQAGDRGAGGRLPGGNGARLASGRLDCHPSGRAAYDPRRPVAADGRDRAVRVRLEHRRAGRLAVHPGGRERPHLERGAGVGDCGSPERPARRGARLGAGRVRFRDPRGDDAWNAG